MQPIAKAGFVATLFFCAGIARANLVTNPSFESNPQNPWGSGVDALVADGWMGLKGGETAVRALVGNRAVTNKDGAYVAEIAYLSAIETTAANRVSVVAGTQYDISVMLATAGTAANIGNAVVSLRWYDGNTGGESPLSSNNFSYDLSGGGYDLLLTTFSETVTAPAGATYAGFHFSKSVRGGGPDRLLIDNVQMSVIPEPTATALLLAGLIVPLALRRCRRV